MRMFKFFVLLTLAVGVLFAASPKASAQISVNIGPAPVCPYGYYDVPPYNCAPYGYYGPEWFVDGVFIGAGPWFHGPAHFWGHVNNRYHPEHGYRGHLPERGEARPPERAAAPKDFKGNEVRNGRGESKRK
jgi:hypothetical protein